jgi:hypothetical protein
MRSNKTLLTLRLRNNGIGMVGASHISLMLTENDTLVSLDISRNEAGGSTLALVLEALSCKTRSSSSISSTSSSSVSSSISGQAAPVGQPSSLLAGAASAKGPSTAAGTMSILSIRELFKSSPPTHTSNGYRASGSGSANNQSTTSTAQANAASVALTQSIAARSSSLTHLSLASCGLTDADALLICDALVARPIEEDVVDCGEYDGDDDAAEEDDTFDVSTDEDPIDRRGTKSGSHGIRFNAVPITALNLSGNLLGDEAGVALAELLSYHDTPPPAPPPPPGPPPTTEEVIAAITRVSTGGNVADITDAKDESASRPLPFFSPPLHLTDLDLTSNRFQLEGAKAMGRALLHNGVLTRLSLAANNLRAGALRHLLLGVRYNCALVQLDLSGNKGDPFAGPGVPVVAGSTGGKKQRRASFSMKSSGSSSPRSNSSSFSANGGDSAPPSAAAAAIAAAAAAPSAKEPSALERDLNAHPTLCKLTIDLPDGRRPVREKTMRERRQTASFIGGSASGGRGTGDTDSTRGPSATKTRRASGVHELASGVASAISSSPKTRRTSNTYDNNGGSKVRRASHTYDIAGNKGSSKARRSSHTYGNGIGAGGGNNGRTGQPIKSGSLTNHLASKLDI